MGAKKGLFIGAFILLGLAVIFGVVSFVMKNQGDRLTRSCTETVSATIIDIQEDTYKDYDGYWQTSYYNVYQYTYGSRTYSEKSSTNKQDKQKIGDRVTIKVNPENPGEFIDGDTTSTMNILFIAFMIASIVMIILAIIIFIICKNDALLEKISKESAKNQQRKNGKR